MTCYFTPTDGEFADRIGSSLCITNCSSMHDESDEGTTDYISASRQVAKLRLRHREI
jgi:hypothetical protein